MPDEQSINEARIPTPQYEVNWEPETIEYEMISEQ